MHIKALPAAFALLAALFTLPSLAQPNVILPSSPEDYSKLAKPALPPGPCTTCGVVTNVRSDQIEVSKKASASYTRWPGTAGRHDHRHRNDRSRWAQITEADGLEGYRPLRQRAVRHLRSER